MILFAITALSPILLDVLLKEQCANNGEVTVVTDNPDVVLELTKYGIRAYYFAVQEKDRRERDVAFANWFMPGVFAERVFPDTDLELWEVLALDRIKFFYNPDAHQWHDFLGKLRVDKVYASLDVTSTLPWIALASAEGKEAAIVQVTALVLAEEAETVSHFPHVEYLVESKEAEKFLEKAGATNIKMVGKDDGINKAVSPPSREKLRIGFGIGEEDELLGAIYDKQDEYDLCAWIEKQWPFKVLLIFPADARSAELALPLFSNYRNVTVTLDYDMMVACDSVKAFRSPALYPNSELITE